MNEELFYKLPKSLVRAAGYYSPKDGSAVAFTSTAKIVYVYMLDRLHFFVDKQKGKHFESQQTIAEACGMEYKAVGKVLRDFIANGVLVAKKGKEVGQGNVHNRYYYTAIEHNLELWKGSIKKPEKLTKVKTQEKKVLDDAPKRVQNNDLPYWMDEDDPF